MDLRAILFGKSPVSHGRCPKGDHRDLVWSYAPSCQFLTQQGGSSASQTVSGEQHLFLWMGLQIGSQIFCPAVPIHIQGLGKSCPGIVEEAFMDSRPLLLFLFGSYRP